MVGKFEAIHSHICEKINPYPLYVLKLLKEYKHDNKSASQLVEGVFLAGKFEDIHSHICEKIKSVPARTKISPDCCQASTSRKMIQRNDPQHSRSYTT